MKTDHFPSIFLQISAFSWKICHLSFPSLNSLKITQKTVKIINLEPRTVKSEERSSKRSISTSHKTKNVKSSMFPCNFFPSFLQTKRKLITYLHSQILFIFLLLLSASDSYYVWFSHKKKKYFVQNFTMRIKKMSLWSQFIGRNNWIEMSGDQRESSLMEFIWNTGIPLIYCLCRSVIYSLIRCVFLPKLNLEPRFTLPDAKTSDLDGLDTENMIPPTNTSYY